MLGWKVVYRYSYLKSKLDINLGKRLELYNYY